MPAPSDSTTCLIAGGGPAGIMLALLLARGGVPVTVMEKHADFLRDFRGDTVHASTLRLLDELGLGSQFAQMPHRLLDHVQMQLQGVSLQLDMRRLPGPHKHIAMAPQWDFLELLASAAEEEPTFTLLRSTEVLGPIYEGARVAGVSYRDEAGETRQMRADLTVACDGRTSTLRSAAGLTPRSFGAPMDVWWFRLPRRPGDPAGFNGVFTSGHGAAVIDRGDYFQIAYIIPKGTDEELRAEGVGALRRRIAELIPWLAGSADGLVSMDDVKLLDVQLNRLRRWYRDGLLLIGDAAHAMSPVGGIGINLAIADAVAAATILAEPLRTGRATTAKLARIQARRWCPTAFLQAVQRGVHNQVVAAAIRGGGRNQPVKPPAAARLIAKSATLRAAMAYTIAIGPLPEHAPGFARR